MERRTGQFFSRAEVLLGVRFCQSPEEVIDDVVGLIGAANDTVHVAINHEGLNQQRVIEALGMAKERGVSLTIAHGPGKIPLGLQRFKREDQSALHLLENPPSYSFMVVDTQKVFVEMNLLGRRVAFIKHHVELAERLERKLWNLIFTS